MKFCLVLVGLIFHFSLFAQDNEDIVPQIFIKNVKQLSIPSLGYIYSYNKEGYLVKEEHFLGDSLKFEKRFEYDTINKYLMINYYTYKYGSLNDSIKLRYRCFDFKNIMFDPSVDFFKNFKSKLKEFSLDTIFIYKLKCIDSLISVTSKVYDEIFSFSTSKISNERLYKYIIIKRNSPYFYSVYYYHPNIVDYSFLEEIFLDNYPNINFRGNEIKEYTHDCVIISSGKNTLKKTIYTTRRNEGFIYCISNKIYNYNKNEQLSTIEETTDYLLQGFKRKSKVKYKYR